MITLFSKTRELETQTDEFCDKISEGVLAFKIGVSAYLDGDTDTFMEKLQHVSGNPAPALRRNSPPGVARRCPGAPREHGRNSQFLRERDVAIRHREALVRVGRSR